MYSSPFHSPSDCRPEIQLYRILKSNEFKPSNYSDSNLNTTKANQPKFNVTCIENGMRSTSDVAWN